MWMDEQSLPWSERGRIMLEEIHPLVDRIHDTEERLATIRATALEGFRAKARIVQEFSNCTPDFADPWHDDAIGWSLPNDLLGTPSVWRADDDGETEPATQLFVAVQPVAIVNPDAELIRLYDRFVCKPSRADCDLATPTNGRRIMGRTSLDTTRYRRKGTASRTGCTISPPPSHRQAPAPWRRRRCLRLQRLPMGRSPAIISRTG